MASNYAKNSTNVRIVKWAVHAAEVVAPGWLEQKAFETWGKPQRRVGAWGELAATGRRFTLEPLGGDVAAWEWNVGGSRGTALLVHGWSGNAAQMRAFVGPLVERGWHVLAFDFPGHGESPGSFLTLPMMTDVVASLVRRFTPNLVVAHSLGATATTRALLTGVPVERVALLAPPVAMGPYLKHFAKQVGLSDAAHARLVGRVERYLGHSLEQFDLRPSVGALARVAALLVHDRGDEVTPFKGSRELEAAWPGARLMETFGFGHDAIRRNPEVVKAVVEFSPGSAEQQKALRVGGR